MLLLALLHPTTITLISALAMIVSYRFDRCFRVISAVFPLLVFTNIYIMSQIFDSQSTLIERFFKEAGGEYHIIQNALIVHFEFMNLKFISIFEDDSILISLAVTIILFVANLYTLNSKDKFAKLIVIFGSLYAGFSYIALFSGDMILLAIALELMMIASSIIIFLGGSRYSYNAAKRYFITHLLSGNMIIIGIACLIVQNSSYEIINLTSLITDGTDCWPAAVILLMGLIVNIAAFPFSGWMVNCYKSASPSGFLYLICFTTKVSVVVLLKLFAGLYALKYVAIAMIIYASFKAIVENNIFSLLCLLSIIQMGFMVIAIGDGREIILQAVYLYLFLHMLYKVLLSIVVSTITENSKITFCSNMYRINNPIIFIGIVIAVMAMVNTPLSATFIIKSYVSHLYLDTVTYYLITSLSIVSIISLPYRQYLTSKKSVTLDLSFMSKFIIGFMSFIVLLTTFTAPILAQSDNRIVEYLWRSPLSEMNYFGYISLFSYDSLKQITILLIALIIGLMINFPRISSKSLNIIDNLGDVLISCYKYVSDSNNESKEKEDWKITSLEKQLMRRLRFAHNQQTAILIVFCIFIVMLVTFIG